MKKDILFGIHPLIEAIKAGKDIQKIFIRKGLQGEHFLQLLTLIRQYEIPSQQVPVDRLNRLTGKNHQGVVALISPIEYKQIESLIPMIFERGEDPFILVLDGITDVRNFGAIVRTAECAGVHAIVLPSSGSVSVTADAIKTSSGALNYFDVCRTPNLKKTVQFLKESGLHIVSASEQAQENYLHVEGTKPVALVLGSEEYGISSEILEISNQMISIPVKGKISSLNVSVATGIVVYEILRQRSAT